MHIEAQPKAKIGEPIALVLAPTRELAMQTAEVAEKSGALCSIYSACIYGGAPKGPQYAALRKGAQIVVATPGRLKDLMMEGAVSLGRTTFLVLDEADRMLDLGFEPEIRALAGAIRADRQTVMFSATWPNSIQALAQEFLAEPLMVRIGAEGTRASHSITQIVEVIEATARDARLEQLLMQYQGDKASSRRCIIFVLYKKEVCLLTLGSHRTALQTTDKRLTAPIRRACFFRRRVWVSGFAVAAGVPKRSRATCRSGSARRLSQPSRPEPLRC